MCLKKFGGQKWLGLIFATMLLFGCAEHLAESPQEPRANLQPAAQLLPAASIKLMSTDAPSDSFTTDEMTVRSYRIASSSVPLGRFSPPQSSDVEAEVEILLNPEVVGPNVRTRYMIARRDTLYSMDEFGNLVSVQAGILNTSSLYTAGDTLLYHSDPNPVTEFTVQ